MLGVIASTATGLAHCHPTTASRASLRPALGIRLEPAPREGPLPVPVLTATDLQSRPAVVFGVRRSPAARLVAFVLALLVSHSAPAQALVHGLTHGHLAHAHALPIEAAGDHDHDDGAHDDDHHGYVAAPIAVRDDHGGGAAVVRSSEHEHGHPAVEVAPVSRDIGRLFPLAVLTMTPAALALPTIVEVRAAALPDHALLARPAPEGGPPPALRAPPAC